jgi:catechol-2,3-dioxygenase
MASRPVISAIGHVALQVRDLEASVRVANELLGLTERERRDGAVDLTEGAPHHTLQLTAGGVDAVDHIGLEAADAEALAEVRARVARAGLTVVSEHPLDVVLNEGFAFEGPEGFTWEVYVGMPQQPVRYKPLGVRPNRLGHVTFQVTDLAGFETFLADVLDFRVSDRVDGVVCFMRCNVDHHGIGFSQSNVSKLHHYAWEVQSTGDVGLWCDRVDEDGGTVLWGPVRHGCGRNIAAYVEDPSGIVIEYYADMERYYDELTFVVPTRDVTDHKWYSLWSPMLPEGWRELGVPPLVRSAAPAG